MSDNDASTFYDAKRPILKKDELEFELGDAAATGKADGVGKFTGQMIPVDQLRVVPGFNVRFTDSPSYRAKHDALVESITANGFLNTKPLTGFATKIDGADVVMITDGHRRWAAVRDAISRGVEIAKLPVILRSKGTSAEDLNYGLIVENSAEGLSMMEKAVVIKRLVNFGNDTKTIAAKLGYTTKYVDDLLLLVAASKEIRERVIAEQISGSEVIGLIRSTKDKTELTAAVKAATEKKAAKAAKREAKASGTAVAEGPKLLTVKHSADLSKGGKMPATDLTAMLGVGMLSEISALVGDDAWFVLGEVEGEIELTTDLKIDISVRRPETVEQVAQREAEAAEKKAKREIKQAELKAERDAKKAAKDAEKQVAATPTPAVDDDL